MSAESSLPHGFEALEPFVGFWAAATVSDRDTRRLDSTESQRVAFYNHAKDLVAPAMDYLDSKPLAGHDAKDQRLMNLMLSLVHVALAVEAQRDGEAEHALGGRQVPITRGHADRRPAAAG
jgi:hypothetical protein